MKPATDSQLQSNQQKFFYWASVVLIAIYFSVFFSRLVNFSAADLGRHIINGELFVKEGKVISTNYYSYTEPEFKVVNHHWLTGVVFYSIHQIFGFKGLSAFYTLLCLSPLLLLLTYFRKKSDIRLLFFISVLLMPILTYRNEIRPEGFSILFYSITLITLFKFYDGAISFRRTLLILLINQVLWTNFHIFFFMQYAVIGFFLLHIWINKTQKPANTILKQWVILLVASILISLLNPVGFKGLLVPFTIFDQYGYMVAENMNLLFMIDRFPVMYKHVEYIIIIVLLLLVITLIAKQLRQNLLHILLIVFYGVIMVKAVRGISMFGFVLVSTISVIIYTLTQKLLKNNSKYIYNTLFIIGVLIIVFASLKKGDYYYKPQHQYYQGWGLMKESEKMGNFLVENNIKGPIFNNYDIGGYLIYYLHNRERVFVDNRPEAYSVKFFDSIYNPMVEKEEVWNRMCNTYNFNSIVFYRHDNTTHGQPFLIRRINDSAWAPVFVDLYNIVFLKRNATNAELIKRFELPKDMFKATSQ